MLLHQVTRQRMPEAMRCHAHADFLRQLPVHGFDLIAVHFLARVMGREAIDVEQLIRALDSRGLGFIQESMYVGSHAVSDGDGEFPVGLFRLAAHHDDSVVPLHVAFANAQQGIEADAGIVERLEDASPEPGRGDLGALARTVLGALQYF